MNKLTEKQKNYLTSIDVLKEDFNQIEKALKHTTFELFGDNLPTETITIKRAIEVLGEQEFLSGISRSAFHWSAVRQSKQTGLKVYFNSSKLFKS